jgi:drug/metabolite transporter (DMT)-like permease
MTIRTLSRTEHPLTILVWFPLATIPGSLIATLVAGRAALPQNATEVAGHLLVTATAFVGQIALTTGLSRAGAARATAVSLAGPVFGVLFDLALFSHYPRPASLAGMAVVLTALGLLGWSGSGRTAVVTEKEETDPYRRSER